MSQEFTMTLNIVQMVLLGGLIWGVARMSKSVDDLGKATEKLTGNLERVAEGLASITARVGILEDRSTVRRRTDLEP